MLLVVCFLRIGPIQCDSKQKKSNTFIICFTFCYKCQYWYPFRVSYLN